MDPSSLQRGGNLGASRLEGVSYETLATLGSSRGVGSSRSGLPCSLRCGPAAVDSEEVLATWMNLDDMKAGVFDRGH